MFNYLIKDDFFADPDAIREFALAQNDWRLSIDHARGGNWPGHRSALINTLSGEIFSQLMYGLRQSLNLSPLDSTYTVSYFQYCTENDGSSWIHQDDTDIYSHVGIVYLTPNPASHSGTVLYHPPENGIRPDSEYQKIAQVKKVMDNKYNRLAIYDPKDFHKSDEYFGKNIHDSRVFIVFFMKVIEGSSFVRAINQNNIRHGVPYFGRPSNNDPCICLSGKDFSQCCASGAVNADIPKGIHVVKNAVKLEERKAIIEAIKSASKKGINIDYSLEAQVQIPLIKLVSRLCSEDISAIIGSSVSVHDHPRVLIRKKNKSSGPLNMAETYNDSLGYVERHSVIDYHIFISLNNNHIGGSIWFGYYDFKLSLERDDIVIIPAHDQYAYELMKVKNKNQILLSVSLVKKIANVNDGDKSNLSLAVSEYNNQLSS